MVLSNTRQIANVSTCAALYAISIAATAFIPTPWGVGQFRPGVVIPVVYAFVGGPLGAGMGATIGTFIGSFILQAAGTGLGPLGSLISGAPANFVAFYLLGWIVAKYRSWNGFVFGAFVSLLLGNFIAAGGVAIYLTYVVPRWLTMILSVKLATVMGLTLFWTVTMLPFVLMVVPFLIAALRRSGLSIVTSGEFAHLSSGNAKGLIYPSLGVAGILAVIYAVAIVTPVGSLLFASVTSPENMFWVESLFALTSGILIVFGLVGALVASRSKTKV
ncbi:MAG: hypothetical protein ABSF09_10995 [Candidatus Bathyarchaeia archaeon]|jgi:hypothetical protein